jgi:septal ring-binding cell division protein DamX
MRVEPVSGLSNPAPGGGRRERLARERNERGSTSLVIIALLLFVISVISISVYFFSRPASDDGSSQGAQTEMPADEQPQSANDSATNRATEGTPSEPSASETADANQRAQESTPELTPPPPAPAPASTRPQRTDVAAAKKPSSQGADSRNDVQETTPRPQSTPRPSARQPESAAPPSPALKTTKTADATAAQWVVQVHSTPSIDDADEWLQQLQSRNIADGRIEPLTQKGSVWYRVRFGRYATRQEAEQAAIERGYRNAWVDRVR